jgi:hypothetical protein
MDTKRDGPIKTALDCENWSEDDKRELRLIRMADELATIAYGAVDWRDVSLLGRAIVALAESRRIQRIK